MISTYILKTLESYNSAFFKTYPIAHDVLRKGLLQKKDCNSLADINQFYPLLGLSAANHPGI
jgi:hypothetical protein